jgi:serine/threonine protein kinase
MQNYIKPAERLLNLELNNGWKVVQKYTPKYPEHELYSSCYIVNNGSQKGFLKAFDYSDLNKPGGSDLFKLLYHKYERELAMLKKCRELDIKSVVKLLEHNVHFFKPTADERVDYFILEYSEDDNILTCLNDGNLNEFANKFQALVHIFDGLEELHKHGIVHLDLKAANLVHFIKDRLTKITDFGSARKYISDLDEDLKNDFNNVSTTRQYAPPEFFYEWNWTEDWNEYRRKIDLYLAGNIVVKLFTNISFTTCLQKELPDFYNWDSSQNKGKMQQFLPTLTNAASNVYLIIEEKIKTTNIEYGKPLDSNHIERLMRVIAELCDPHPMLRGHPKERDSITTSDGLYRYRDKFITLKNLCEK